MTPAQLISDAGQAFGRSLLSAVEDAADAVGAAGPGMKWETQVSCFEAMLEKASDYLNFYGDRSDEALDLFLSTARIEFYGAHASSQDRTRWLRVSQASYAALNEVVRAA